jgi:DNA (cytosine-5)-methyltransferase 1
MGDHSLRGEGFDASEDGTGRGTPLVPVTAVAPTLDQSFGRLQGASGQDANHGHGHLVPVAYSIMPMNSGKDYKARPVDVAQPVMAAGPAGGNQGGDYIVQPIAFNARQDPISGPVVGPVDTDGGTHAIAYAIQERAISDNPDHGPDGVGVREELAYTLEARSSPQAVAFSLRGREGGAMPEVEGADLSPALRAAEGGSTRPFIAFDETQITSKANRSNPKPGDPCHPLAAAPRPPTLASPMAVRRITVVEAEKLQGFAENATLIHWPTAHRKGVDLAETIEYLIWHGYSAEEAEVLAQTPDGPRYRAIGNSWPTNVARWIGERMMMPGVWRDARRDHAA